MSSSEYKEYQYLLHKYVYDADNFTDKDKVRYEFLLNLYIKEREYIQETSYWNAQQKKFDNIVNRISKDVQFKSTFVKKCQSRQTGEKTVFYDIELVKSPEVTIYDIETDNIYNKYHFLRGRTFNLSYYASIKQDIILNGYIQTCYLPCLYKCYEKYVKDNFYGKEIEFEGEKVKAFQIDWFDEVYIADEKIPTSFQKWYNTQVEKYNHHDVTVPDIQFTSYEQAYIDYVERYNIHSFIYNCKEMANNPEKY